MLDVESKYGQMLGNDLVTYGLTQHFRVVAARFHEELRRLDVELAMADADDWTLRHAMLEFAAWFEDKHDLTVRCFFREESEALTA